MSARRSSGPGSRTRSPPRSGNLPTARARPLGTTRRSLPFVRSSENGRVSARLWTGREPTRASASYSQHVPCREKRRIGWKEAIAAYREALKERTRERVPLDWASTQNSLATALSGLATREGSTPRYKEAVAAYREALKEWTRERAPADWARVQYSLGSTLRLLAGRRGSIARYEEAVAAYREALKEFTREGAPLEWALTQEGLGTFLSAFAQREGSIARYEKEAIAAYREALKERTRERAPAYGLGSSPASAQRSCYSRSARGRPAARKRQLLLIARR